MYERAKYDLANEARDGGAIGPPVAGVHSELVAACERMGKLIILHDEILCRLRGPQPESTISDKQAREAREPQGISAFLQMLHQQLSSLEQQTVQIGNALV